MTKEKKIDILEVRKKIGKTHSAKTRGLKLLKIKAEIIYTENWQK